MAKTKIVDGGLAGLTGILMLVSLYMVFMYAPIEQTMGPVQKIFYFHLPLAILSFVAFFLVFLGSLLYLYTRQPRWDQFAVCAVEIGLIFCTLVLITGSIWARSAWNIWWTWDPRLTTYLIVWCLYVAYLMLRNMLIPGTQTSNIAAVFGLVSFVNVPISFLAIRMWRSIHPVVIDSRGAHISAPMRSTLLICFAGLIMFFVSLLRLRWRVEQAQQAYLELVMMEEA